MTPWFKSGLPTTPAVAGHPAGRPAFPSYPWTLPLAALIFLTMILLTFVCDRWPLRRLDSAGSGIAAIMTSFPPCAINRQTDGGAMEQTSPVPVMVALAVAIIGSIVLYNMDFVHHTVVRNEGILKISREALARAGANATPTPPNP